MRRLRTERRLSQAVVAKALGCKVPKISLMENEARPIQEDDLKTLLELFDVPDDERRIYFEEADNAHKRSWWEHYDDDTVPDWLERFIGLEQGAERIRAYQPAVVHGLLQTPEYIAGLFRDNIAEISEEKIGRLVEIRRRRQRRLSSGPRSPQLWVILDEAALRHVVGGPATMRAQLDHVVGLCKANENVSVQAIPFDRGAAYEAALGAFTVLSFGFATDNGLVYRERQKGAEFLDSLLEVDDHSLRFQRLSELALSPSDSLDLLTESAQAYAQTG
jgi:transcriptional regulator with XRE-family HTH domain